MFPVRTFSAFKNGTKVLKIRPGTLAGLKEVLKPQFFKTGLTNFFPVEGATNLPQLIPTSKDDPGDKPDKYKTNSYSDKDNKHYRGHKGHGPLCISPVTAMTLTLIPYIVHTASPLTTAPHPSKYLLYATLVLIVAESASAWQSKVLLSTDSGSVVFNLTYFNEVTLSNETLYRLHDNVIDSCIDINVDHTILYTNFLITLMRRRALNPT